MAIANVCCATAINLILVFATLALSPSVQAQVVFSSLSPMYGLPGTEVALAGSGFPTAGILTVNVGGADAPIIERRSDLVRFSIPPAATSGAVKLIAGGVEYRFQSAFTVTRLLSVQIAPEMNIAPANYSVGSIYNDAPGAGPNYAVEVAKGEATLVAASAGETDPVLMAVVTDAQSSVVLNAQSTALGLMFATPGVAASGDEEAVARVNFFAGRAETSTLANAIQNQVAAGHDYLGDATVESSMLSLLEAFANEYRRLSPTPTVAQLRPQNLRDDFVNGSRDLAPGFPRDLETPGYQKLRRLATSVEGVAVNERGLPVIRIKVKSAPAGIERLRDFIDVNPLDWMANLYELSPADVDLNTFEKVKNLRGDFANVYDRVTPAPLESMHVKAKLASRILDLPELATDFAAAVVSAAMAPKEYLEVPADRPGLYIIRAFSGARFDPQTTLVNSLPDGRQEAVRMTALNIFLAIHEAFGIVAKEIIAKDCFQKFIVSLIKAQMDAIDREMAQGTLTSETLTRLFLHGGKSFIKDSFLKCGILNKDRKGIKQLTKVCLSALNLAGKMASVGKVVERMAALGNLVGATGEPQRVWMAQAIEDTIIVVGNPWQPQINSFAPRADYRGALVRIHGRNFSGVTNQNIVTFGLLSTDPTNAPAAARAEVLVASTNSLVVRVPEGASDGAITVTVVGKGTASTAELSPPFQTFTVLPDPLITSINPNPPVAGQVMQINGANFARITDQQELVFGSGVVVPVFGSPELLVIRAPNSTAPNSVKVRIRGRQSNVVPFAPVLPSMISTGATIYVSTQADSFAADGDISLREAILYANGGADALGRQLTSPPDPRPAGVTYETDYVSFAPGSIPPGAGARDFIRAHSKVVGKIVSANALPTIDNYDDYDLDFELTGGSGDAIRILGSRVQFRAARIRNFSGHGVVLSGNASENLIRDTVVEGCGGTGFRLEGRAHANTFYNVLAGGCEYGLHLSGAGVQFNKTDGASYLYCEFSGNRNFGVLVDDGASMNDLVLWSANSNNAAGIRITGGGTVNNVVRKPDELPHVARDYLGHIYNNGGPGIWINAPSNVVRGFNVRGNAGDGILIEDSICSDVVIREVRSGVDDRTSEASPNQGSGLHIRNGAHEILIGNVDAGISGVDFSGFRGRNYFAGNRDNGIWIEGQGTRAVEINLTHVGQYSNPLPNGTNGIAITGGAESVIIGGVAQDGVSGGNLSINNHTNGAGIYMAQTRYNWVTGCSIGRDLNSGGNQGLGNKYGIQLTSGAYANVIGFPGAQLVLQIGFNIRIFDARNYLYGNQRAAILLQSGGDPTRTITHGEVPTGGNVVQNNFIGDTRAGYENKIGILIRDQAYANRIGGSQPGEANVFSSNTDAGILIDGAVMPMMEFANRIIGNVFTYQGGFFSANLGNPIVALPTGVAVAIINGASGHIIGGENPGEGNFISDNYVGVEIVQSRFNHVIGNIIDRSRSAGVVLLQSRDNNIGPLNEVYRSATRNDGLGGIVLKSSTNNWIAGNWIGTPKGNVISYGNRDYGIGVLDSPENILGAFGARNIVYGPTNGIFISGSGSYWNKVTDNYIGITAGNPPFQLPNRVAGVLLANGAIANEIGTDRPVNFGNGFLMVPAPNYIQRNMLDGVRVDGPSTLGNSILYNSISDHSVGLGIQNINGGNTELPPPSLVSYDGVNVVGSVHASIPNGSRVQLFMDNADEGRSFLSEEVVVSGQFRFAIPLFAAGRINATVTHALDGHTSEFAPLIIHTNNGAGLLVQRVTRPPATNSFPVPGGMGVSVAFRLRAIANPVLVASLTFRTTGTANESAPSTRAYLFRDEDHNAQLGQNDFLLAGPRTFTTNNANLTFTQLGRVIDASADQDWLLVVLPATNAAVGETFSFELPAETSMTSHVLMTGENITESGEFPLLSDTLVVTRGTPPSNLKINRHTSGELVLEWMGDALLESAADIMGPWNLIPDAAVPFIIVPTEPKQFFRFRP